MTERESALGQICLRFQIDLLYAFGSRALEVKEWLAGKRFFLLAGPSDVDVGVRPLRGTAFSVHEKAQLALGLEELFEVDRVDLVSFWDADPFLAANIVRGERLYARDQYQADEYDLYILRRAGDLAPFERERWELILKGIK